MLITVLRRSIKTYNAIIESHTSKLLEDLLYSMSTLIRICASAANALCYNIQLFTTFEIHTLRIGTHLWCAVHVFRASTDAIRASQPA